MVRRNLRYAAMAAVLGMIPACIVLYEFFLAPATRHGGVVIPTRLWYVLCAFTPALLPLLSAFEKHRWAGGFLFALPLLLSNILIYGLCGFVIGFVMKKLIREDRSDAPQAGTNH